MLDFYLWRCDEDDTARCGIRCRLRGMLICSIVGEGFEEWLITVHEGFMETLKDLQSEVRAGGLMWYKATGMV